jgi:hypothetical protein
MILTDIVPPFLIISPTLLLGFNSVVSALLGPRAPNRTRFASKKKEHCYRTSKLFFNRMSKVKTPGADVNFYK